MSTRIYHIILFLCFNGLVFCQQQDEILVTTDTSLMQIGEHRQLDIEVLTVQNNPLTKDWIDNLLDSTLYLGRDTIIDRALDDFEVFSSTEWNTRQQADGRYLSSIAYEYTAWKDGYYLIPGVQLSTNQGLLQSDPLQINVFTPIDTSVQGLAPIKDIIQTSFDFSAIKRKIMIFWLLKLALFTTILIALVSLFKKSLTRTDDIFTIPYAIYSDYNLKNLKNNRNSLNQKQIYTSIVSILKSALEKRYKFGALGYTTSMIDRKLATMTVPDRIKIMAILKDADAVKYARTQQQQHNIQEDIDQVERIVHTMRDSDQTIDVNAYQLKEMDASLYEEKRIEQFNFNEGTNRFLAGLIDMGIILFTTGVILFPFGFTDYIDFLLANQLLKILLAAAITLIVLILAYVTMGHYLRGMTIGKKLMNIEAVDIDGGQMSFIKALARTVLSIISLLLLGIGLLILFFDDRRQSIPDKLLKTFVVDRV